MKFVIDVDTTRDQVTEHFVFSNNMCVFAAPEHCPALTSSRVFSLACKSFSEEEETEDFCTG